MKAKKYSILLALLTFIATFFSLAKAQYPENNGCLGEEEVFCIPFDIELIKGCSGYDSEEASVGVNPLCLAPSFTNNYYCEAYWKRAVNNIFSAFIAGRYLRESFPRVAFRLIDCDSALDYCFLNRFSYKAGGSPPPPTSITTNPSGGHNDNITPVSPFVNYDYSTLNDSDDYISLIELLNKGVDTIYYRGLSYSYTLKPSWDASLAVCPSEFGSTQKAELSADVSFIFRDDDPQNVSYIPLWIYNINGRKKYIPNISRQNSISFRLSDLEGVKPLDNVVVSVLSKTNKNNSKVIRFYPELPRIIMSSYSIPPMDSLLRNLNLRLSRTLNKELDEKLTVLTCYKSIKNRPDGVFNISESEVLFQIKLDESNIVDNYVKVNIPKGKYLKKGAYYFTLEGTVMGKTNNPDNPSNKVLSSSTRAAMFYCTPIFVEQNSLKIYNLTIKDPVCYKDNGSVEFLFDNAPATEKGGPKWNIFEIIDNKEVEDKSFKYSSGLLKNVYKSESVKPGHHTFRISLFYNSILSSTSTFDVFIKQPENINIPISTKNISGFIYSNNILQSTNDGLIIFNRAQTSGGTPPYKYLFSDHWSGQSSDYGAFNSDTVKTGLPGYFMLTIIDKNNCINTFRTDIKQNSDTLGVNISLTRAISCYGANDGVLKANILGNLPPSTLSYSWYKNNEKMGEDEYIGDLGPGNYIVNVRSNNKPLSATYSYTLREPTPLKLNNSFIKPVDCYGGSNGSISAIVSGGRSPYNFSWNNGLYGQNIYNITAGKYKLRVQDQAACTKYFEFEVKGPKYPLKIVLDSFEHIHYNSNGRLESGYISAILQGGTPPYSEVLCGYKSTPLPVFPGSYTLSGTDSKKCYVDTLVTVLSFEKLVCNIEKKQDINCFNGHNGECELKIYGGRPPYSIKWSNESTDSYLSNLTAGTYRATVTDSYGYFAQADIIFNDPPPIEINFMDIVALSYGGYIYGDIESNKEDGRINLDIKGGTPPYSYKLINQDNGSSTQYSIPIIDNLSSGNYTLSIFDNNGCNIDKAVYVPEFSNLKTDIIVESSILCNGNAQGKLRANTVGGVPPYYHSWTLPSGNICTDSIVTDAIAGIYELKTTDANGIISLEKIVLSEPEILQIAINKIKQPSYSGYELGVPPINSNDGEIELSINGGSGNKTWILMDEEGWVFSSGKIKYNQNTNSLYNIYLDSLPTGNFTFMAYDSNNCSDTAKIYLPQVENLWCNISPKDSILCYGKEQAKLSATAEGGVAPYSFKWAYKDSIISLQNELNNVSSGIYKLFVTDANGIISSHSFDIKEPDSISGIISVSPSACYYPHSGNIRADIKGGIPPYSYSWKWNGAILNRNSNILDSIGSGIAELYVTDYNGCKKTFVSSIVLPPELSVSYNTQEVSYSGVMYQNSFTEHSDGLIELNVNGGTAPYSYRWYNLNYTDSNILDTLSYLNNLSPSSYTFSVFDFNGCSFSDTVAITKKDNLSALLICEKPLSCHDSKDAIISVTTFGGTPPISYSWTHNNSPILSSLNKISELEEGLYSVCVTDSKGVKSMDSIRIISPSALNIVETIKDEKGWGSKDGSISVNINGGKPPYKLIWSKPAPQNSYLLDCLSSGTYSLWVQDSMLCSTSKEFQIKSPDKLELINIYIRNCNGSKTFLSDEYYQSKDGSIQANIIGGVLPYSYIWLNSQSDTLKVVKNQTISLISIDSLNSGNYTVCIYDANGFYLQKDFTIELSTDLQAVIKEHSPILCTGGTGKLEAIADGGKPPYNYVWFNSKEKQKLSSSSNITDILYCGEYDIQISDSEGRVWENSFVLTEPKPLSLNANIIAAEPGEKNYDGKIELQVSGGVAPYKFLWNNSDTNSYINYICDSNYSVSVTDFNSCSLYKDFTLNIPSKISTKIICLSPILCNGENTASLKADITGGKPPYTLLWSNGEGADTISNLGAGFYSLLVRDRFGSECTVEYYLQEPELLDGHVVLTEPSCFDLNNGSLSVELSGGNYPYKYFWNTGQQSSNINQLKSGWYIISALDQNMCSWTDTIILKQPDLLRAEINIQKPICLSGTGNIYASAIGGTPPFSYLWSYPQKKEGTSNLISVKPGYYGLYIKDSRNCTLDTNITLPNAQALKWNLKQEHILCPNKTLDIEPEFLSDTTALQSFWTLPTGAFSWGNSLNASLPGKYKFTLIQHEQCLYYDSIFITQSKDTANCIFWISTVIQKGEICTAVDLSDISVDSSTWIIPNGVKLISRKGAYAELSFPDTGKYPITLVCFKGMCSQSRTTVVNVEDYPIKPLSNNIPENFFNAFVAPNPNNGKSKLFFSTPAPASIDFVIMEIPSGKIINRGSIESDGEGVNNSDLSINSTSGIYLLVLKSGENLKTIKIVVNK